MPITRRLTAAITPEDGGFVAQCLEIDIASQGDTIEEATANLKEALELRFEDGAEIGPAPIIALIEVRAA